MKKELFSKTIAVILLYFFALNVTPYQLARAQPPPPPCSSCIDISINTLGAASLCGCMDDTCIGNNTNVCHNLTSWQFNLSSAASCCIDSIAVNPPIGVCWEGCMGWNVKPAPILWQNVNAAHINCSSGYGSFWAGPDPPGRNLCPGDGGIHGPGLEFDLCCSDTNQTFILTFYFTDGTPCIEHITTP